ncbi:hypothetical protein PFMALIP_05956, partial [Plasmodium falciparum MaliPS096_E11]
MARGGSPQGGGGSSGEDDKDAKNLLDSIGEKVYREKVKDDAKTYDSYLKGNLASASIFGVEGAHTTNPCNLKNEYDKLINGSGVAPRGHPCRSANGNGETVRYSKERVDEYDNKKIKCSNGSNGKDEGACASFRRLHLCNKNFPNMNSKDSSKAKNDLLVDVCMAAKYEGESLKTYRDQYDATYPGSGSTFTMCTMLARSFADIGDIIRGKDLYRRDKGEKKKLEEHLKTIFGKIYKDLKTENGALQARYNGDDNNNYSKLREDWWTANRATVWKAITCSKELNNSAYFRPTCSHVDGRGGAQANKYCRCNGDNPDDDNPNIDPPTYFDYVPQYLRWFEEWAEDFCRKKKKYVNIVKKYCRGKYQDADRYCSRNGFDCEKTISRIGKVRMGKGCTDCFFACYPYEKWIDNQRKQFLKQKKQCENEISGNSRQRRGTTTTNYEGYEKQFYEELKTKGGVDAFLEKLNEEDVCKKVDDDKGGTIHFENVKSSSDSTSGASGTNNKNEGTFYRSDYCQPCPDCGVRHNGQGEFVDKETKEKKCAGQILYKPKNPKEGTPINFLYSGDEETEIGKKLKAFCLTQNGNSGNASSGVGGSGTSGSNELYQKWTCYHVSQLVKVQKEEGVEDEDDVPGGGGLCILKNERSETNSQNNHADIQKTFHNFFYYWVAHMLKDSIYWRTKKIKKCLENGKTMKCRNGCNSDCGCFEKWVEQKKNEWKPIKQHFYKQPNIPKGGYFITLELNLEEEFLKEGSQSRDEDAKETKRIKEMFDKKPKPKKIDDTSNDETILDFLLQVELNDATECKKCEEQKTQPDTSLGRAETGTDDNIITPANQDDEDEEDEEEEDSEAEAKEEEEEEEDGDSHQKGTEDPAKEAKVKEGTTPGPSVTPAGPPVDVCKIVDDLFKKTESLQAACSLKYGKNAPTSWKCISDSGVTATGGSICVPPRRRKLYIGKIKEWAGITVNGDSSESSGSASKQAQQSAEANGASTTATTNELPEAPLRRAFVESAAVETFFLWDRYKKEWKARHATPEVGAGLGNSNSDDKDKDPQEELQKSGTIPTDFLRQMFYTLADYKDILFSGGTSDSGNTNGSNNNNIVLEASGSTQDEKAKMEKIQQKLKTFFSNSGEQPSTGTPPGKTSVKDPKTWWETNGEYIWKGMIYALTYKDNTDSSEKGTPLKQDDNLKEALWEDTKKKPKKDEYEYDKVKLDEHSGTEAKSAKAPKAAAKEEPTTLKNFVERPPYFRYLEEWGQNFCKERKKRLEEVRKACREKDNGDPTFCSGDGHDCTDNDRKYNNMLADLDCRPCYEQCRKYRKWIDIKFEEYHKQEKKYQGEYDKLNGNSNGDYQKFYDQIEQKITVDKFLAALKHCKDDQGGEEKVTKEDKKNNEIKFEEPLQTFSRSTYCKTCPPNEVNCSRRRRGQDPCKVNFNGNEWQSVFNSINGNGGNSTTIDVHMIDRRGPFIEKYLEKSDKSFKDLFKTSRLFKAIREQEWECRFNKDEDKDVCKLDKFDQEVDLNQHTTFKVLLIYWLEDFIEGYYLLKKKKIIEQCTQNKEHICDEGCEGKYKCVKEWVEKKKKEWEEIKTYFNKQNRDEAYNIKYTVESLLGNLIPRMDLVNDKGKVTKLSQFDKSCGCSASANVQKDNNQDAIDCMITNLQKKIEECKQKHTQTSDTECSETALPQMLEDETLDDDIQTEEVKAPNICPNQVEDKKKEEEGDDCERAEAPRPAPTPAPAPAPAPAEPAQDTESEKREEPPPQLQSDEPSKPIGDILSSTIPFGIAIALTSIVFLFLK